MNDDLAADLANLRRHLDDAREAGELTNLDRHWLEGRLQVLAEEIARRMNATTEERDSGPVSARWCPSCLRPVNEPRQHAGVPSCPTCGLRLARDDDGNYRAFGGRKRAK